MDEQALLATLAEISDRLIPKLRLDTYEQALYWYLFRQTHVLAAVEATISYTAIEKAIGVTKTAATRRLRSLEEKGCIKIVDTGWGGTKVSVSLPEQILGPSAAPTEIQPVDIETINFFAQEQYREAILHREGNICFYCLRKLSGENYASITSFRRSTAETTAIEMWWLLATHATFPRTPRPPRISFGACIGRVASTTQSLSNAYSPSMRSSRESLNRSPER